MRRLLLTSQGITTEFKDDFLFQLQKPPNDSSVAFVTTAAYGEEENPKWLDIYRKQLENCGIQKIEDVDLRNKTSEELENILSNKDVIFVNGGNAFYLLYWMRKSGFDKIIYNLLDEGKLYVGISAGSYVVCPTIEAATWKHQDRNKVGLKNLTGLNLIPFLITAHFEEKYRPIIEKAAKETKYPIVALYDTQAILVQDNSYKVVGTGKREFFNGFKER